MTLFIGQAANYRARDILKHTFAFSSSDYSLMLRQYLAKRYGATPVNTESDPDLSSVYLYHNGRSALAAALQTLVPRGSGVIVNGFTCHAVAEAVRAAGCAPVYADIQFDTLHFDAENLKITLKSASTPDKSPKSTPETAKTSASPEKSTPEKVASASAGPSEPSKSPPIRALIIQNTLGLPVDIAAIEKFAKQHRLVIIEDLAHCAGRAYPDGREVGTVGHAAALSFGKGKSVDTISGGALILRRPAPEFSTPEALHSAEKSTPETSETHPSTKPTSIPSTATPLPQPTRLPRLSDRLRDRFYPLLGRLIRTGYYLKIHKLLTALFLKLHWISRSADAPLSTSVRLPHWQAKLALHQLLRLQPPLSPLRAHAFVENRADVLTKLEKSGFKFDEIWYDVPISPARYYHRQNFPEKSCPNAVWAAAHIVNLPTFYPEKKLKPAWKIIQKSAVDPAQGSESPAARKKTATAPAPELNPTPESPAVKPNVASESNAADPAPTNLTSSWPALVASHPEANFLQSPAWAEVNRLVGHQVLVRNFGDGAFALMIIKNARRGRYLEIPGGPLVDWRDSVKVEAIFQEIRQIAAAHHCAFIRLRPQLLKTPENLQILKNLGAKPAPFHLHAEHTVMLDLDKTEEELLSNMRRQTRYEVRRADKQGIIVKKFTSREKFEEFHAVQAETARRQNFVPPSLEMLLAEHQAFGDDAPLYVAYAPAEAANASESPSPTATPKTSTSEPPDATTPLSPVPLSPVAYGLILISAPEAAYFEAASTDLNRKLPGAYALQWQVIRDLKAAGLKRYNLWGIAPPDQPHHRYAKVTTFKTGFGGDTVEYVPAHDIIINKVKYLPNLAVETMRKKRRHLS